GLTTGSIINFLLARVLGRRYVAKWMSADSLERFDRLARHQGTILFFAFFVFPGFPKDYLCIFLGLTGLSFKVFVLMAGIGRIPGTFMLSLQGAQVFQRDFTTLAVLIAITLAFVVPAYIWRRRIYTWVDRLDAGTSQTPTRAE
ncbi:MAG: VTT domain-containing protein, partial [Deltaproteobacteria bacterium]|nr:VTT domain-containing protein [Deltaproteobacteria bacterium]